MADLTNLLADIIKMICMLVLIYAVCTVLTSGVNNKKTRKRVAMMAFIPMGIIAVVAFSQSLASSGTNTSAMVVLSAGVVAVVIGWLISTNFGREMLASVVGNAIYDIIKSAFRVLLGIGNTMIKLFKR